MSAPAAVTRAKLARIFRFAGVSVVVLALLGFAVAAGAPCLLLGTFSPCGLTAVGYAVRDALVFAGLLSLFLGVGLSLPTDLPAQRSGDRPQGPARPSMRWVAVGPRVRTMPAAIGVGVAVVSLAALALVPVPQPFAMHGAVIGDPNWSCTGIETAPGTTVSFHWSAASPTVFYVLSCSSQRVAYQGNGTAGSGSFVSIGGVYQFGAACTEGPCATADVVGTVTAPVLPL